MKVFVSRPGIYYLGIIDILQAWNWEKQLEHWVCVTVLLLLIIRVVSCVACAQFKRIFACHCIDWRDLSAIEPK